jgi:hypothetical protein
MHFFFFFLIFTFHFFIQFFFFHFSIHPQVTGNGTVQIMEYISVLTEENYIKFLKKKRLFRTLFVAILLLEREKKKPTGYSKSNNRYFFLHHPPLFGIFHCILLHPQEFNEALVILRINCIQLQL